MMHALPAQMETKTCLGMLLPPVHAATSPFSPQHFPKAEADGAGGPRATSPAPPGPPGSYRLSSLYHWKSAEGTAEASHSRMPFCPTGTPVLFASEMYGGSAGKTGAGGWCLPPLSSHPFFFPHVPGGKIISEPMPSSSYSHTSFPGGFGRGTQSTS